MADDASQEEVREIMELSGISKEMLDTFFDDVGLFNKIVDIKGLTNEGFVTIDGLIPEYDVVEMMERWEAKSPDFLGYNCRITSYDLMKDSLVFGKIDTTNTDFISFDQFAIASSPRELFNETKYDEFETLYSYIPTELTKDIDLHVKNIQEDWKKKKLNFLMQTNVHLFQSFSMRKVAISLSDIWVCSSQSKRVNSCS